MMRQGVQLVATSKSTCLTASAYFLHNEGMYPDNGS